MRVLLPRTVALTAAAFGLLVATTTSTAAAAPAPTPPAATPQAGPTLAGPSLADTTASPVFLVNGDRSLVSDGGVMARVLTVPGTTGLAAAMVTLHPPGATFLVPGTALPYLGHGLDPRLFEVSALQQAEHDGRLPLSIGYRTTLPTIPGVRVTSHGAGRATGYLTAASAARFGAALARQFAADHPRDSYGEDGIFAGGVTLSLTGVPAAPAQPRFPQDTVTVRGTNLAGKPDTGDEVDVWNDSNPARFDQGASTNDFFHGTSKFSVPQGTYWAVGIFFTRAGFRLDVVPQFTVDASTAISVDERAATSQVVLSTPLPTVIQEQNFYLVRGASNGPVVDGFTAPDMWVNPVATPPTFGTLRTYTVGTLASPPTAATPYSYSLNFAGPPGTIPPQHWTADAANLATIHNSFYQDVAATGAWVTIGGTPAQLLTAGFFAHYQNLPLPEQETHYVSSGTLWETDYGEIASGLAGGGQAAAWQVYPAGENVTDAWNAYPLHPTPQVGEPTSRGFLPVETPAARKKNTLMLSIEPFGDNAVDHHSESGFWADQTGSTRGMAGRYALYQNGKKLASGNAVAAQGLVTKNLSPAPSTVKYVLTASRTNKKVWVLSTRSRDVWTWPSKPEPDALVPSPLECGVRLVHGGADFNRHCAVQDVLVPRYQVAGISLQGTTQAGAQTLDLTIGHLQGVTDWPITTAGVQVSYDNGTTWQPAALTSTGPGQFQATYNAPASATVSLRVTARDFHGATVTETITGAYATAA